MLGIIGPRKFIRSKRQPLEGHIAHLRHLTNIDVARSFLENRHNMQPKPARETASKLCAHIQQGIEFHEESVAASQSIHPVLQYYSWLNLAVASIHAYQPPNFQQYRQHGVEDLSHQLIMLDLPSKIVKIRQGALPLFHSIISGESIHNRIFRFLELAAAIPVIAHELSAAFGKKIQNIEVFERLRGDSKTWRSEVSFTCRSVNYSESSLTRSRIERAIPILLSDYSLYKKSKSTLTYLSKKRWTNHEKAERHHRTNCRQMINFGGHFTRSDYPYIVYHWHGVSRMPLIPTLTACMLLAFSLASIARYRPLLGVKASASPINLLIDVFIRESDSIVIPAIRNLLYREEVCISERSSA